MGSLVIHPKNAIDDDAGELARGIYSMAQVGFRTRDLTHQNQAYWYNSFSWQTWVLALYCIQNERGKRLLNDKQIQKLGSLFQRAMLDKQTTGNTKHVRTAINTAIGTCANSLPSNENETPHEGASAPNFVLI